MNILKRLDLVLSKLAANGLRIEPSKCYLFRKSVEYLGHIISENGIATDPSKVSAVKDWPTPSCVRELRAFLGLSSYYRRYVKGFTQIAMPLHKLVNSTTVKKSSTKTDGPSKWYWDSDCEEAFNQLKQSLVDAPVLGYPNFKLPFILETDASHFGLGAVLSQVQNGSKRVIAYASHGLRGSEKNMTNYSAMKLELLALKWAITEKFRGYLQGSHFTVYTDNNPLKYVKTSARLAAVEQRWVSQLSQFHFEVLYPAGKMNSHADGLSRRPHSEDLNDMDEDEVAEAFGVSLIPTEVRHKLLGVAVCMSSCDAVELQDEVIPGLSRKEFIFKQQSDPVIKRFCIYWNSNRKPTQSERTSDPHGVSSLLKQKDKLSFDDGLLIRIIQDPIHGHFETGCTSGQL